MLDPAPYTIERDGSAEAVHTPLFTLGHEDRPPDAEGWDGSHLTGAAPLLAFSKTPVRVRFQDETPVVLSSAIVATPGRESEYTRSVITPLGQRTIWAVIRDDTMARLASEYDPSAIERPDRPLGGFTAPVNPHAAVLMHKLETYAFTGDRIIDPLLLEESIIQVCELSIRTAYESRGKPGSLPRAPSPIARRAQLEAVNEACEYICLYAGETISLAEISDAAELSPGYLCRVFREHVGMSVHQYLTRVRVLGAVDELSQWRGRLSALARRSGFSSHAHLVTACRRLLGASPTELSELDARQWLDRTTTASQLALIRRGRVADN